MSDYNGWSNYETWAVALWLDNEQSTYTETREVMRRLWDLMDDPLERNRLLHQTRGEATRYHFMVWLKDYVEDMCPQLGATLWADLLNAALSEVDWYDIADNWLSELDGYESHLRPLVA